MSMSLCLHMTDVWFNGGNYFVLGASKMGLSGDQMTVLPAQHQKNNDTADLKDDFLLIVFVVVDVRFSFLLHIYRI